MTIAAILRFLSLLPKAIDFNDPLFSLIPVQGVFEQIVKMVLINLSAIEHTELP